MMIENAGFFSHELWHIPKQVVLQVQSNKD